MEIKQEILSLEEDQRKLLKKRRQIKDSLNQIEATGRQIGLFSELKRPRKVLVRQSSASKEGKDPEGAGQRKVKNRIKDKQVVQRNRRMFGNILNHLKRARKTLKNQKDLLQKQQDNYDLADKKHNEESNKMKEKQRKDIERRRRKEMKSQFKVEKEILKVDHEVLQKRIEQDYLDMTNFFVTKTNPPLLWCPNKIKDGIESHFIECKSKILEMKDKRLQTSEGVYKEILGEFETKVQETLETIGGSDGEEQEQKNEEEVTQKVQEEEQVKADDGENKTGEEK